ncbi:MAG: hypothetical protein AB1390_07665 [Nitrospirota bacterium]
MHKILWSFYLLLCFFSASCSDQKPAPIQMVTGKSPSGGSGYLELAGPEFVSQNLQFTMNVKFSMNPKFEKVPLWVETEGCEVIDIGGSLAEREQRENQILPLYRPAGEFMFLDNEGRFNTTVTVKAGTYESGVPRVDYAKGNKKVRECVLNVSCGGYANATLRVAINK